MLAPPATPTLSSPYDGEGNILPNAVLVWNPVPGSNSYRLQLSTDSLFATLVFDDSTITTTSRQVSGLSYGGEYYWRVRAKNGFGYSSYSSFRRFTVLTPQTLHVQVNQDWNTISVPLTVEDARKSILFPSAVSPAYAFSPLSGYVLRDTLKAGVGYWLKFAAPESVPITGGLREEDSISVHSGWNLIGSIASAVSVGSIVQTPDSIVRSVFYTYNSGYSPSDSIIPGKAYWVKTTASGTLFLSSTNGAAIAGVELNSGNPLDRAGKITIEDAEGNYQPLYFGEGEGMELARERYELPPAPPQGVFDVRYGSQYLLETLENGEKGKEFAIHISGAQYPLTVRWSLHDCRLIASLKFGSASRVLGREGSMEVSSPENLSLKLENALSVPKAFALSQNYPNPFNPATVIGYDLPVDSRVSLKVYDILGREIVTLVDGVTPAGSHVVTLDGTHLASGVYLYRLEAGGFTSVRKLLLLK